VRRSPGPTTTTRTRTGNLGSCCSRRCPGSGRVRTTRGSRVRLRHRHPRDPRTRLAGVRHRCRARGHPPAAVSGPGRADARAPNDGGSDGAGRAPGGRPDLGRVQPLLLPPAAMVGGLAEGTRRGPSRWPVRRPDPGRTGHLGAPTERSRRSHANRPEPCSTASRSNASRRRRRTARRARVRSTGTCSTCLPAGRRDRVRTAGRDTVVRPPPRDPRRATERPANMGPSIQGDGG
jgi:hypothetical protein